MKIIANEWVAYECSHNGPSYWNCVAGVVLVYWTLVLYFMSIIAYEAC